MKTVNTVSEILTAFPDSHFDRRKWRKYAESIHPELSKLCEEDTAKYEFEKDVLPVIEAALTEPERIRCLGSRFEDVMVELNKCLPVLFDRECEVTVILYLGLCNAAGRVTFLGGEKVMLLGVEKILELNWDSEEKLKALLYHEIGHVWHETYGELDFPVHTKQEQSMLQLWQEGIAMVCEQILSGDEMYYHQDGHGWQDWCQENEKTLTEEYRRRMECNESTQDFFGDWCDFCGHSDVGYYLGCRFVRWMMKKRNLREIAVMQYQELMDKYSRFAEESYRYNIEENEKADT